MGKRVFLFIATNLAIIVTLSIVLTLLGASGYVRGLSPDQLAPVAVFCLVWGMGGAFLSLALSRIVAKWSMGVKLVDGRTGHEELDWLHNKVAQLAQQAGLPMPEVGVYDSPEVNAFATGPTRSRALVAVSTGLLRGMSRREVEGVLGHEISHVANGDMVTMTLLQGVINAFVMFIARIAAFVIAQALRRDDRDSSPSYMVQFMVRIVLEIALGILGSLITAWFSRYREFRADYGAARLTGRDAMIAALKRLQSTSQLVDNQQPALASFKIAGGRSWMSLFSTHPPLEERIAALQRMS
jgi:heat shock protein HtpX